jgi:hypothetical protein
MSNEQEPTPDKKENNSESKVPEIKHKEPADKCKDTTNQSTPPEKPERNWLLIFTFFLVIFNGILAWTSIQLSCNAINNTKIEMRAYVQFQEPSLMKFTTGQEIKFEIPVNNTGKTYAEIIEISYSIEIKDTSIKNFDTLSIINDEFPLGSDNPVTQFISTEFYNYTLTKNDSIDVIKKKKHLIFFAQYIYRDVFNGIHRTKVCCSYDFDLDFSAFIRGCNEQD